MPSSTETLLHAAYAYVRAQETNKSMAPLTLDHLLQEQIEAIEGGDSRSLLSFQGKKLSSSRVCKLDQLAAVEKGIAAVVEAAKKEFSS